MSLAISIQHSDPLTIVLTGRLDTHTAPDLDKALEGVLATPGIQRIVFDLGQLEYLSSAGIRCFIRARKGIEPGGGTVAIVHAQPPVRKVLEIVKAIPPGGIFGSTAELDAYLDDMQRRVRDRE
jgi:anti-anti-sigma factor